MSQIETGTNTGYRTLLTEKGYMMNLIANLISRFGDSIDSIAYGWMIYDLTGSKAILALLFGINAIPNIIFQPIAGVFVDYFKKKKVVALCDIGRGLLVILTAVLYWTGYLMPWHLILITFFNSTLESFRTPASISMFPYILSKEKYSLGTAFTQSSSRVVEIAGFAAAGIIIGLVGISGAIIIDGLTFLISGAIIINIIYGKENIKKNSDGYTEYFTNLKEGLVYFRKDKLIFNICLFGAIFGALLVPFNSLQAAYVGEGLSSGPEIISLMNIAMTIGMILGSLFYPKLAEKFKGIYMFIITGISFGFIYIILSALTMIQKEALIPIITITCFTAGVVASIFMMIVNVAFMTKVNKEYIGRVAGLFNSLAMCATPVASMIIASIAPFTSILFLYAACGVFIILLFVTQIFNKHLRDI
ncbi:MFS transporter [Clostridium polynesiense]|uniref:MFS transporter n=1 Tax=Clostridium polynesiense TaxID=1325933 RepID=UPI00058EFC83|nr:MFS transporter [Clostridium polynesiense]